MRMMTIQNWLEKLANIQVSVIFGLTKNIVDEEFIFAKNSLSISGIGDFCFV